MPSAVYVHIPFCRIRCPYCDFDAYRAPRRAIEGHTEAVLAEIASRRHELRPITSLYFGGGTPTTAGAAGLRAVMETLRAAPGLLPDAEVTVEANPTPRDAAILGELRGLGVTRVSLGVQSFTDRLLPMLGRDHSAAEAADAVRQALSLGLEVSLDLMCGVPGQTMRDWQADLATAAHLSPGHISVYMLTLEAGTRYERLHAGGRLELPGEDEQADMYEAALERLAQSGYEHYEVSNLALPGRQSRHNRVYWQNREYAGFGAGASSCVAGQRWTNESHPTAYAEAVRSGVRMPSLLERLPPERAMRETLALGLRLLEGVELTTVRERYGAGRLARVLPVLRSLAVRGLVTIADRAALTRRGLMLYDGVAAQILAP
ncbi:MAG: radical SAM family heme chaperone HemW [Armatimonadetes bacterium]|nr:radical SAM family heme chaperone HemW [Armatimonadota bacterium]